MFTPHTKIRRWLAALLVLAMMIGMLPASATTAYATDTSLSQIPVTVTVENTHPEGITINLFDYWLDAQVVRMIIILKIIRILGSMQTMH